MFYVEDSVTCRRWPLSCSIMAETVGEPISWTQARAFRLARMHLSDPLGPRSLRRVVSDLGGVQAQVASAAAMQCALRAPGTVPEALPRALWRARSLVKTWMMRGTIHYLAAEDLPVWAAASATRDAWKKPAWQKYTGLSIEDVETAVGLIANALDAGQLTREGIADHVAGEVKNTKLDDLLRSGWGSVLKIVASRGLLCFGPNEGRNVTFVRPDRWLKGWAMPSTEDAIEEVCRRYLASHGPATREDFARWWGFSPPDASKVLARLGDEVTMVDREGDKAYALSRDLGALRRAEEDRVVRALPMFDAFVLAGLPHDAIVPKSRKNAVYRAGAWVSQTIARGGEIVGVWTHEPRSKGTNVEVSLFEKRAATKAEIGEALEPLQAFIGPMTGLKLA